MIPEIALALCISHKLPTAWGLAPPETCVLDCDVTSIYRHAIPASLVIGEPVGTCERAVVGHTKDEFGTFQVVYMPDGTWHWLREQDPLMCEQSGPDVTVIDESKETNP